MTQKGWIALHRKIQDHWLWEDKPFSKQAAWVDMLLLANHDNNKFLLGNELVEVKCGSFITSIEKLKHRWGWSNTKVINFLKLLESDEMVTKKSDAKKTVITIVNYRVYSDYKKTKTMQERCENDTATMQEHTNNNDNNDNNDNNVVAVATGIDTDNEENQFNLMGGTLGKNVILLTEAQEEALLDKIGFDAFNHYVDKLSRFIIEKDATVSNHYATILKWAKQDAAI